MFAKEISTFVKTLKQRYKIFTQASTIFVFFQDVYK